jgi:hypothetical protein
MRLPRITCRNCGDFVPPKHHKYCLSCSRLASALWKRASRKQNRGAKYWLDDYLKAGKSLHGAIEAYRRACRLRVKRYRHRQRRALDSAKELPHNHSNTPRHRSALRAPLSTLLILMIATVTFGTVACDNGVRAHSVPKMRVFKTCANPLRIIVLDDITDSGKRTGIVQPSGHDLAPLATLTADCGGEIALGLLADRSDVPLARCSFDRPPRIPSALPDNVLLRAEVQASSDQELEAWHTNNATILHDCLARIENRLHAPAGRHVTDVFGALRRARLFLDERHPEFNSTPMQFAIFVSDGEDTLHDGSLRTNPQISAQVLVVNSTGAIGVLHSLSPIFFESAPAAVHYVCSLVENRCSEEEPHAE